MKLRPILFSTPMVQALIAGTKTQTRRIVKPQPIDDTENSGYVFSGDHMHLYKNDRFHRRWQERFVELCKYEVGDVLWVRETFTDGYPQTKDKYLYKASYEGGAFHKWKPSLFMPFEACRLFLELTSIRVERLQDISEEDAKAEGAVCTVKNMHAIKQYDDLWPSARQHYHEIWQNINGKGSWAENPYVWCYTFRVVPKPTLPQ